MVKEQKDTASHISKHHKTILRGFAALSQGSVREDIIACSCCAKLFQENHAVIPEQTAPPAT